MRVSALRLGQFVFTPAKIGELGGADRAASGLSGKSALRVGNVDARVQSSSRGDSDPAAEIHSLLARLRQATADEFLVAGQQPQTNAGFTQTIAGKPRTEVFSTPLVAGVNSNQISLHNLQVAPFGGPRTIQGTVTQAASGAVLTVVGASGATATAGGLYRLTGPRGDIDIDIAAGGSLHDVATRINQQSESAGVTAVVTGDNLILTSSDVGHAAAVQLQPLQIDAVTVATVNSAQVDEFAIASFSDGETETLSGSVVSTVTRALLTYRGTGGVASGTAAFQLTGTRGTAGIAITEGESLAAVAQRINDQTASTGVVATVVGNDLQLTSDTAGAGALVRVDSVELEYETNVSGLNESQIADLDIVSLAEGSQHVLSGQITRSASKATVYLQGAANATVIDTGSFELSGTLGSTTVSITQGETLSAVASRVNDETELTGVSASVDGTQLVFESVDVGSAAEVSVELLSIAHTNVVSGVNSQQITAFQVDQFTQGATQTLSGSVTQAAGQAQLIFTGLAGLVGTTATFTLSGSLGSAQISASALQSLSSLATQVNQNSAATGVTAVVQSNQLIFRSAGVGSAATIGINVTSGSFNVTGGNGNGTANGTNAVAVINGQTITGAGNQFSLTDALGSYSFTTASGFTGALTTITIESQAGSFELSGGNGDGTASGLDALAVINSVALTGVGNRFAVSEAGDDFEIEFASDFTGTFDSITIESTPDPFDIDGGDGAGTAVGTDAVAMINGIEHTSADGRFTVVGEHGSYELEFADGFTGGFDDITVESVYEELVNDGDENGRATGSDAQAVINGQAYVGSGSQFQVSQDGLQVTLDFQASFAGAFDPIQVIHRTRTVTTKPEGTQVVVSGDTDSAALAVDDPLAELLREIDELLAAMDQEERVREFVTPNAADGGSRGAVVRRLFREVYRDVSASWLQLSGGIDLWG